MLKKSKKFFVKWSFIVVLEKIKLVELRSIWFIKFCFRYFVLFTFTFGFLRKQSAPRAARCYFLFILFPTFDAKVRIFFIIDTLFDNMRQVRINTYCFFNYLPKGRSTRRHFVTAKL